MKKRIIKVGNLSGGVWDKKFLSDRAVYDEYGVSPALTCFGVGGTEVKILVREDEETDTLQT